ADETTFWQPIGGLLLAGGNLLAMIGLVLQWESRLVLLLWTIDAALVWAAGFWLKRVEVRCYGLLLAVLLVGVRVLYLNDDVSDPFRLLLNDRFGTLLLVAMVYLVAAWMYRRMSLAGDDKSEVLSIADVGPKLLDAALAVLGN